MLLPEEVLPYRRWRHQLRRGTTVGDMDLPYELWNEEPFLGDPSQYMDSGVRKERQLRELERVHEAISQSQDQPFRGWEQAELTKEEDAWEWAEWNSNR